MQVIYRQVYWQEKSNSSLREKAYKRKMKKVRRNVKKNRWPWILLAVLSVLIFSLVAACKPPPESEPTTQSSTNEQPDQLVAEFGVGDLLVSPTSVIAGETVTINANINNSGNAAGVYKAALSIDGQVVEIKEINIMPSQSSDVEFIISDLTAGKHQVAIGKSTASIDVLPKPNRIAFLRNSDGKMHTMDSNGTNVTYIAENRWWPTWSPDGTQIAYESNGPLMNRAIFVMDADGDNAKCITPVNKICQFPAWSPDGRKIAYCTARTSTAGEYVAEDLYVMNSDGTDVKQLTPTPRGGTISNLCPKWFPDSKRIAFVSNQIGVWEICSIDIYSFEIKRYGIRTNAQGAHFPAGRFPCIEVSPDGTQIAFEYAQLYDRLDICICNINTGEVINLTKKFGESNGYPTWSPDGQKIGFTSKEQNSINIYVADTDDADITLLMMDGLFPVWQR